MPGKVLVTGADGLLGSNLTRELIEQGFSVRVLIQPGSKSQSLNGLPVEKISGDLVAEDNALKEAVNGVEAVFHCAAITNMWAKQELVFKVNLGGTRRILELCVGNKVRRLVFVGSASSFRFGSMENPGTEQGAFPLEYKGVAYMESKHQALNLVREYVLEKGLDAVMVMPTFMLGAYDSGPSSGELIRQFIIRKMRFVSPGGRNFVYVKDVAKAMISALEKGKKGEAYILGGKNLTYLDFFQKVAKLAGTNPPKAELPGFLVALVGLGGSAYERIFKKSVGLNLQMARLACLGTYYSPARAVQELGMGQTPIELAIAESLQSLKEYGYL